MGGLPGEPLWPAGEEFPPTEGKPASRSKVPAPSLQTLGRQAPQGRQALCRGDVEPLSPGLLSPSRGCSREKTSVSHLHASTNESRLTSPLLHSVNVDRGHGNIIPDLEL